jgi:glyoxylase-like metal-dependent hydrolase (beta-lactamase superfamily II)
MRWSNGILWGVLSILVLTSGVCSAASVLTERRQVTKLAEGVFAIRHRDPYPGWVHGNTTVIIGATGALVVDSCQLSDCAREDIAQIREWTDKPVRYLVNTHWHLDHTGGNRDYADAFPGVVVIAQKQTQAMMNGTAASLPRAMLRDATSTRTALEKIISSGKTSSGAIATPKQKATAIERLSLIGPIIDQAKAFAYRGPDLGFDREVSLDLGKREVEVRYLGRGNTAGDCVVYLPKEKIVIAGDLLDHPVPYAFDGYPAEWVKTLAALAQLDTEVIVPGHGEVLHDKTYLHQVTDLMNTIVTQVNAALDSDDQISLADVKKKLDLSAFRQALAGNDPITAGFFDSSVGASFVELAYREAKQR